MNVSILTNVHSCGISNLRILNKASAKTISQAVSASLTCSVQMRKTSQHDMAYCNHHKLYNLKTNEKPSNTAPQRKNKGGKQEPAACLGALFGCFGNPQRCELTSETLPVDWNLLLGNLGHLNHGFFTRPLPGRRQQALVLLLVLWEATQSRKK